MSLSNRIAEGLASIIIVMIYAISGLFPNRNEINHNRCDE